VQDPYEKPPLVFAVGFRTVAIAVAGSRASDRIAGFISYYGTPTTTVDIGNSLGHSYPGSLGYCVLVQLDGCISPSALAGAVFWLSQ
jgi:hypothetical protein